MREKDMVNDVLSSTKAGLTSYSKAISECSNQKLRNTLQQIRDQDEKFQFQLYQIAEQKGYYKPAKKVNQQDVDEVRNQFSPATTMV